VSVLATLATAVDAADALAGTAATDRLAALATPPGALGRLGPLAARLAAAAGRMPPPVPRAPVVLIAAADHGVHARGITPWPQAVTTQMVELFCAGRATVNALARTVGASVAVVDVGCAHAPAPHAVLRSRRVRAGTRDLATATAMTRDEVERAVAAGAAVATELLDGGADLLVTGDMGIANTTATACLTAACTGRPPADVTGPGAGVTDPTLAHKTAVVGEALRRHRPDPADPVEVLAAVGGLEHAALVGAMLTAAARRVPVVLDGAITTAAALVAVGACPALGDHLIASHRSPEPAADVALAQLGLVPLLDLGMRLGEGTGGVLAVPVVQAAARVLADVATLADLGAG
jgi:nicotinate-nucleotide--dimethylbenzimidazole phosphoribosyltransferase